MRDGLATTIWCRPMLVFWALVLGSGSWPALIDPARGQAEPAGDAWRPVAEAHSRAFEALRTEGASPERRLERRRRFNEAKTALLGYLRTARLDRDGVEYLNMMFRMGVYFDESGDPVNAQRFYRFCLQSPKLQDAGAVWEGKPLIQGLEKRGRGRGGGLGHPGMGGPRMILSETVTYSGRINRGPDPGGIRDVVPTLKTVAMRGPAPEPTPDEALEIAARKFVPGREVEAVAAGRQVLGEVRLAAGVTAANGLVVFAIGGDDGMAKQLYSQFASWRAALRAALPATSDGGPLLTVYANATRLQEGGPEKSDGGFAQLSLRLHRSDRSARDGYFEPLDHAIVLPAPVFGIDGDLRVNAARRELVNARLYIDCPLAPRWLQEGLSTLYEMGDFAKPGADYRLAFLIGAMDRGILPTLEDLLDSDPAPWLSDESPLRQAMARYLCLTLASDKLRNGTGLRAVYGAYRDDARDGTFDRTSEEVVGGVVGLDWPVFEVLFRQSLRALPTHEIPVSRSIESEIESYLNGLTTDARLARLRSLPSEECQAIRRLNLGGSQVTDLGLRHLAGLSSLIGLNLGRSRVTDSGLRRLAGLSSLTELELHGTRVTDRGLSTLYGLLGLKSVNLEGTRVTDAGVAALRAAVPGVDVRYWKDRASIGDNFPTHIRIAGDTDLEYLRDLKALSDLSLDTDKITDRSLVVVQDLATLRKLRVRSRNVTDQGLERIGRLANIEELHLGCPALTDDGLKHLSKLSLLKELNLSGTKVTDRGLAHLRKLGELWSLNLNQTAVTDAGLQALAGAQTLIALETRETKVTPRGLVDFFARQLHSPSHETAGQAADRIAVFGAVALPPLIKLANDDDPQRRRVAMRGLGQIRELARGGVEEAVIDRMTLSSIVVPTLVKGSRDPSIDVRRAALNWLMSYQDFPEQVLPVVIENLKHADDEVRFLAAQTLSGFGEPLVPHLLIVLRSLDDPSEKVRGKIAGVIASLGAKASLAVPKLTFALDDLSTRVRADVAQALGAIGPAAAPAVPRLVAALDEPPPVQASAMGALGKIGPDAAPAVPKLVARLADNNPYGWVDVADALGGIGPPAAPALTRLLARFHHEESFVRAKAAETVGRIRAMPARCVPELRRLLQDSEPRVRLSAVEALGRFAPTTPSAVEALREAMRDPDSDVRTQAKDLVEKVPSAGTK